MTGPVRVEVSRRLEATPQAVFDAWIEPKCARQWLFATDGGKMEICEIDPKVGGGFHIVERRGEERAEHFGEYVALDRPRLLAFDFWTSFSADRTRVTVTVSPDGDGSIVTVAHEGVSPGFEDKTKHGWSKILEGLETRLS